MGRFAKLTKLAGIPAFAILFGCVIETLPGYAQVLERGTPLREATDYQSAWRSKSATVRTTLREPVRYLNAADPIGGGEIRYREPADFPPSLSPLPGGESASSSVVIPGGALPPVPQADPSLSGIAGPPASFAPNLTVPPAPGGVPALPSGSCGSCAPANYYLPIGGTTQSDVYQLQPGTQVVGWQYVPVNYLPASANPASNRNSYVTAGYTQYSPIPVAGAASTLPPGYYLGSGLFGRPKLFRTGQPVRNFMRSVTP